jgi:Ca2+-binding RTX toxin-like protein
MNWRALLLGSVVLAIGVGGITSASAQSSGITANFSPAAGVLTIKGSNANNSIVVSRDPTDQFVINGGQVPIAGGTPTLTTTSRILIFGLAGDDGITVEPMSTTPPPPSVTIFGSAGNTFEEIAFSARGGNDTITVDDLSGTTIRQVNLNLELADGSADQQPDLVTVYGTPVNDTVRVDSTGGIRVSGLLTTVAIVGAEVANDQLTIAAQDGDDRVDASALAVGSVRVLLLDGGAGNDHLIGSPADDALDGGQGEDTLDSRAGVDNAANGEVRINIP